MQFPIDQVYYPPPVINLDGLKEAAWIRTRGGSAYAVNGELLVLEPPTGSLLKKDDKMPVDWLPHLIPGNDEAYKIASKNPFSFLMAAETFDKEGDN